MTLSDPYYVRALIEWHQANPRVHPLTCGVSGDHVLVPVVQNHEVTLVCPEDGWWQRVPTATLQAIEKLANATVDSSKTSE